MKEWIRNFMNSLVLNKTWKNKVVYRYCYSQSRPNLKLNNIFKIILKKLHLYHSYIIYNYKYKRMEVMKVKFTIQNIMDFTIYFYSAYIGYSTLFIYNFII